MCSWMRNDMPAALVEDMDITELPASFPRFDRFEAMPYPLKAWPLEPASQIGAEPVDGPKAVARDRPVVPVAAISRFKREGPLTLHQSRRRKRSWDRARPGLSRRDERSCVCPRLSCAPTKL